MSQRRIDEYIGRFAPTTRDRLREIRAAVSETAPDAVETMSYGMPTFDLNGTHLIHFAGWKKHVSVYPVPSDDSALGRALAPYAAGKGTAHFPLTSPVPRDLVESIVAWRLRSIADGSR